MPGDLSRWSSKKVLPVQWYVLFCSFYYFVIGQNTIFPAGACGHVKLMRVAKVYAGLPFDVGEFPVILQQPHASS